MRFLRTVSTRRLLATIGGLVAAIAAGTAIAVAAAGSGPVPGRTLAGAGRSRGAGAPKAVTGIIRPHQLQQPSDRASDLQGKPIRS